MTTTIIYCILAALLSGLSGYYISYRFNRSDYGRTDTSGDFGTPRGGYFAIMSGCLIGMWTISMLTQLWAGFPKEAAGPSMLTAMIVGFVAGVVGLFRGAKTWRNQQKKD